MTTENHKKDPASKAHELAERDMAKDPDMSPDSSEDLDEGELARRDNSDEEAVEAVDKTRPRHTPSDPRAREEEKLKKHKHHGSEENEGEVR